MTAYNVISPSALAAGQPEDVSVVLSNLQAIAAILNGQLDNGNLSPLAAISPNKLAGFPSDGTKSLLGDGSWGTLGATGIPVGALLPFPVATPPAGWLVCDGAAVSRTTYPVLFALIGVAFGAGDGSTTFALPDIQGRGIVGKGPHADVDVIGDNDGLAAAARTPKHRHTVTDPGHFHNVGGSDSIGGGGLLAGGGSTNGAWNSNTKVTGITVGPAGAPLDGAPWIALPYIIKAT
jgi:microcystin-dependent protein